jgi:hypothetical protein
MVIMPIKSLDYIITAKHYGNGSARQYIKNQQIRIKRERGIAVTIKDLEKEPTGAAVTARIWQGQWIADCECNSASFVDPDEPVFFCFGCGNRTNGSKPRPVKFPDDRKEIERLILERPVDDMAGLTDMERAGMAKPMLFKQTGQSVLPLTRSWDPWETVEDLLSQQEIPIREWRKNLKAG